MASLYSWSLSAGSNGNSDSSINWPEGQVPGSVNDSSRAMMGRVAEFRDDISGAVAATGTANGIVVTANSAFTSLANGRIVAFRASAKNTGAVTLNVNSLGAKPVRKMLSSGETALSGGEIQAGGVYVVMYSTALNSAAGAWQLMAPSQQANTVATLTALKALVPPVGTTVYVQDAADVGNWTFTSGDFAARVTADTGEGAYVAASGVSTSTAAWVREGTTDITTSGGSIYSRAEGASQDVWYFGRNFSGSRAAGLSPLNLAIGPSVVMFDARYDYANVGTDFSRGIVGRIVFGSSAAKGGRVGIIGEVLHNLGATNSANGNRNYVGLLGISASLEGDGGTNTTSGALGSYFGGNFLVRLEADAENVFNASGAEINVYATTGASAKYVTGVQVAGFSSIVGADVMAAYSVGGGLQGIYGTHVGWKHALLITDIHGADAMYPTGTIIGHYWKDNPSTLRPIKDGIDFTGFTFSGHIIKGTTFTLTDNTFTLGIDGSSNSTVAAGAGATNANLILQAKGTGQTRLSSPNGTYAVRVDNNGICFFDVATPQFKASVTGSRGGNAALQDLLAYLDNYGLINDTTTA